MSLENENGHSCHRSQRLSSDNETKNHASVLLAALSAVCSGRVLGKVVDLVSDWALPLFCWLGQMAMSHMVSSNAVNVCAVDGKRGQVHHLCKKMLFSP